MYYFEFARIVFCSVLILFWLLTKFSTNLKIQRANAKPKNKFTPKVPSLVIWYRAFSGDTDIVQLILHLIFGVLQWYYMVFVGFHLLLIINLVDTMKNVLRSITTHIDQLAQTFIFAFLLLFFIAMITATSYT